MWSSSDSTLDIPSLIQPRPESRFNTVLFLGAGASAPFGFPLSNQLLKIIYQRLKRHAFSGLEKIDSKFLACALETLIPSIATSNASRENIPLPAVLGTLNHMLVAGTRIRFQNTNRSVADVKALLEYAIADQLMPKMGKEKNHRLLKRFVNVLNSARPGIGVISTNYDVCIEQVIFDDYYSKIEQLSKKDPSDIAGDNHRLLGQLFDFGTSWRQAYDGAVSSRPLAPKFAWYKLHGSLNWLRCDQCEHIYINPDWPIATLSIEKQSESNTCHCGYYPLSHLLVTPSLVRDIRETNLLEIWRHALELLRIAKQWVFVGYSLPTEDIAIRSILQRAFTGCRRRPPDILVIDYTRDGIPNADLQTRYSELFPKASFQWGGIQQLIQNPHWIQAN